MKMILKDGSIVEGTAVTDDDLRKIEYIVKFLNDRPGDWSYLYQRDCEKIARYLVINYNITPREVNVELAEEYLDLPDVEPIPVPQVVNDAVQPSSDDPMF